MKWTLNGLPVDSKLLLSEDGISNTFDLGTLVNYTGKGSVDVFNGSIELENYFRAKAAFLIKRTVSYNTYILWERNER